MDTEVNVLILGTVYRVATHSRNSGKTQGIFKLKKISGNLREFWFIILTQGSFDVSKKFREILKF